MATYTAGQIIDTRVVIDTNHGGRWQFAVCPKIASQVTQACFDDRKNWLTRIEYPGIPYYYLPLGDYTAVDMQWKLPDGVTCDSSDGCMLQWRWFAEQSCYLECDPLGDIAAECGTSVRNPTVERCANGFLSTEQYHNCVDIMINAADGSVPAPGPIPAPVISTPAPVPVPVADLIPAPITLTPEPVPVPVADPIPAPVIPTPEPVPVPVADLIPAPVIPTPEPVPVPAADPIPAPVTPTPEPVPVPAADPIPAPATPTPKPVPVPVNIPTPDPATPTPSPAPFIENDVVAAETETNVEAKTNIVATQTETETNTGAETNIGATETNLPGIMNDALTIEPAPEATPERVPDRPVSDCAMQQCSATPFGLVGKCEQCVATPGVDVWNCYTCPAVADNAAVGASCLDCVIAGRGFDCRQCAVAGGDDASHANECMSCLGGASNGWACHNCFAVSGGDAAKLSACLSCAGSGADGWACGQCVNKPSPQSEACAPPPA
ncbi:hypothetical protein FOA52_008776 [Chlamydomonas sp. UWO 241]|nr:hypothetical protein FOA52_008776 [Chlamydomonas sp. UWO 241]